VTRTFDDRQKCQKPKGLLEAVGVPTTDGFFFSMTLREQLHPETAQTSRRQCEWGGHPGAVDGLWRYWET